MNTYIALLRGINVSGQKKIKMAHLKTMLQSLKLHDVITYIQSGNIVFKSVEEDSSILEDRIKKGIENTFGFDVPVLVLKRKSMQKIFSANPYTDLKDIESNRIYFVLLKNPAEKKLVDVLMQENYENERFQIAEDCIYLTCTKGYGNAKCNNNFFERKLKVSASTRNYKTMEKLLELSLY
ncbi:MAG: DUF1697 domain-containing protein [Bacteroidota bacterium]